MLISGTRNPPFNGAVAVVLALKDSPFIAGYRFEQSSGWGTKYSDPGTLPSVTNGLDYNTDIAVAPSNAKVAFGGKGSTALSIYDFDVVSGFGTLTTDIGDSASDVTDIWSLAFSQDQSMIAIAIEDYITGYNWDSSSLGTQIFKVEYAPGNQPTRTVAFTEYDSLPRSGDNEFLVWTFDASVGGDSVDLRDMSGTRIDNITFIDPDTFPELGLDQILTSVSQSGLVLDDNTRTMVFVGNGDVSLQTYKFQNGVYQANLTAPSVTNAVAAIFDPSNRLITAETGSPYLRIWTQATDGVFTQLDTATGFTGGTINSLAYDKDQDILFVASQSSPYITAYRMNGSGFGAKYSDPSAGVGGNVVSMSLVYDEKWKSFYS